jgi:hypothetical protein
MGGRNRLLNYRPTRSSTLEFARHTPAEVFDLIGTNEGVITIGTKPPAKASNASVEDEGVQLEDQALEVIEDFDYDQFPSQFFVDKTQREVDRALKNLANTARREYLDKGLSILYVAFGALKWIDDSGDHRRSPLLFIPVELRSDGPKQPHRLYPSPEDRAGNPALELKLREFGLTLPSSELIDEAIETSGLASALDLYRELELPEGWVVEEMATLSTFMFAKEAMFRDLEANEDRILESPVLNVIADSQSGHIEQFAFESIGDEQIDNGAPPELAPLVLDADSSQRAAIAAARDGKSFVLDGPPGTGKSQTIANIIATLINDGKKVLFVSEKAVALDVVRERLDNRGLGSFLFELHSHRAARSEVAMRLARALETVPIPAGRANPSTRVRSAELRNELNQYADAMNEVRAPLDLTVHEALGALEVGAVTGEMPSPVFDATALDVVQLAHIRREMAIAASHWDVIRRGENDPWAGLEEPDSLKYDLEATRGALRQLHNQLALAFPGHEQFGMDQTSDWKRATDLLTVWNSGARVHSPDWLIESDFAGLSTALQEYAKAVEAVITANQIAEEHCGTGWRKIPLPRMKREVDTALTELLPDTSLVSLNELAYARQSAAEGRSAATTLTATLELLSAQLGLRAPTVVAGVDSFIAAAEAALSDSSPNAEWMTSHDALTAAAEGARALRAATLSERTAGTAAAQYFTDAVQTLDVEALTNRLAANSTLLKRFGREARDTKREVASVATASVKESLPQLSLACVWQESRELLATLESQHRPSLGKYDVSDEQWTVTEQALEHGNTILGSADVSDAAALYRALSDPATRSLCIAHLSRLKQQLSQWRAFVAAGTLRLPIETSEGEFDAVRRLLESGGREASRIGDELEGIARALGGELTLEEAWGAATSLIDADAERLRLEAAHAEFAPVLRLSQADISTDVLSSLAAKLEWTRDVRATARAGATTTALTSAQVAALSSSLDEEQLTASGEGWERLLQTLVAHFNDSGGNRIRLALQGLDSGTALLESLIADDGGPDRWLAGNSAHNTLNAFGLENVVQAMLRADVPTAEVSAHLVQATLRHWVNYHLKNDKRLQSRPGVNRDDLVTEYRNIDRDLIDEASREIILEVSSHRPKTMHGQSALIRREGEKKRRHIPVRQLVDEARNVIQAIHPCFMMSPLAVSQYLPSDIEFDVVIFDEASQVTPGDAINCIYRGKALITAGDQRQLPPTNFFAVTAETDEDSDEDDLANDYESILDLMKSCGGFSSLTLRWHYRSRHEHLITYSNHSFYDGRLITFPGAIDEDANLGVHFHLVDGIYRRSAGQDNPKEAQAVADRVINHFDTRPNSSLGVVAFSAAQRDSIENAITIARAERPDLDQFFQDDRLDGLFIKSLEEVQGDERDVIIMSVGYGPDESGKVYRNFGPINRKGGERRLNVAITRARQLVEVVTSMTAAQIGETSSEGSRHLRRYLDFAERGTKALALELGSEGLGTDSPFEDSVIDAIRSWGYEVQPQVGVAGFRIDIGVKHPDAPGVFMLGVECDGAMYHSSRTARDRDRLRHEVLEGLGWQIHHIWGTAWYRNRDREIAKLKELLDARSRAPISGRLVARDKPVKAVSVVETTLELAVLSRPEWVVPYEVTKKAWFPAGVELDETHNAMHIVPFVMQVVETESPVHFEVLSARLRERTGIGRVGHRIRATLERAVQLAEVDVEGPFLIAKREPHDVVRTSDPLHPRGLEHVHLSEMERAIRYFIKDATGASRTEVIDAVARSLGWFRKSAAISATILASIEAMVDRGEIREGGGGLTLA